MDDQRGRLKRACFQVAKTVFRDRKPIDSDEILSYADAIYDVALDECEANESLGCSISTVIRAIHYINQAHAIPPIKGNIQWFSNTLRAVIEVAYPNAGLEGEAREFLVDMNRGIATFNTEDF
jgi:hypothetical protein